MFLKQFLLYLCVLLTSVILGGIIKKRLPPDLTGLYLLILVTFICESAALICAYAIRQNNFIYMIFGGLQIILLARIYTKAITSKRSRKLIKGLAIGCFLFFCITAIINKAWINVNSEGSALKNIYAISLCLLLFMFWIKNAEIENILLEPMFWVNTGFFIFFGINIFFYVGYHYLQQYDKFIEGLEPLHYFSNLFLYSCIAFAFYLFYRKLKRVSYG